MNGSQTRERESVASTQIEPLLNEHQYASITGESVATARRNRLLRKGCPYVKLTARVFYRPADVRAYIERNLRSTQDGPGMRPTGGGQPAEAR
jgi:hypothetical protein